MKIPGKDYGPKDCHTQNFRLESIQNVERKNFKIVLLVLLLGFSAVSCKKELETVQKERPNILLIMADDMGFSDLGCMGGEINTPHLDRLADNGILFTQFYNNARCCPTRASLMTGLYPHQAGMGWMTAKDLGSPSYRGELSDHTITIPELCKANGYNTYMSGKWHLTRADNMEPDGNIGSWPLQRGFDRFFGTINGAGSYYEPPTLTVQNKRIEAPEKFYYTDAISDTTVAMIRDNKMTGNPFFMYVSYTAPHWPLHAPEKDFEPYVEKYMQGWDSIRHQRFLNLKKSGLVAESTVLPDRNAEAPVWDGLTETQKKEMAYRMAIYAAQIEIMDRGIGEILDELENQEQLDNTMILFLQDNGASAEFVSRGDKDLRTLGATGSFESYRLPWANASNSPFRMFKKWTYEGGIATPMIVHWPNGIIDPGRISERPGQLMDIMATCTDVMNVEYPNKFKGRNVPACEGESLVHEIFNEGHENGNNRSMFWEHEANCAVRMGDWKLVFEGSEKEDFNEKWRLYNIAEDRTETNDLSQKFPQKVMEMSSHWKDWAKRISVYPLDNRSWQERLDHPKELTKKLHDD